ncbi:hypothetical protein GCM10009735_20220 [Actinomadura chokoriensis]
MPSPRNYVCVDERTAQQDLLEHAEHAWDALPDPDRPKRQYVGCADRIWHAINTRVLQLGHRRRARPGPRPALSAPRAGHRHRPAEYA